MTTYTLIMDLLFESGKHQEVLDLFADLKSNSILDIKYPRDVMTIVMAAAYNVDTKEAYEQAKGWMMEARKLGTPFSNRCTAFFVALAIKHGEPEVGYELTSQVRIMAALTRNVKLLALAHMKRPDDALLLIRTYLSADRGDRAQQYTGEFTKEAIDALTQAVNESNQQELVSELEQTMRVLREGNHISDRPLAQMLHEPIEISKRLMETRQGGTSTDRYFDRSRRMAGIRSAEEGGFDRGGSERRPQFGGGWGRERDFRPRGDDQGFRSRGDDQGFGRRDNRGFDRRSSRDQDFERRGLRDQD